MYNRNAILVLLDVSFKTPLHFLYNHWAVDKMVNVDDEISTVRLVHRCNRQRW